MGAQVKEVANKKAVRALRDELMNSNTALPLLLLIAQVRLIDSLIDNLFIDLYLKVTENMTYIIYDIL